MGLKETFTTLPKFQANLSAVGLDFTALPLALTTTYPIILADNFNDATKDPKWLTSPIPPGAGPAHSFAYSGVVSTVNTAFTNANDRYAESFVRVVPIFVNTVKFRIAQINGFAPPGTLQAEIWGTTGPDGQPNPANVLAISNPIVASTIPVVEVANLGNPPFYALVTFTMQTMPTLPANVKHAIVLRHINPATQPTNSVVEMYRDAGSATIQNGGFHWISFNSGSTWSRGDAGAPPYSIFQYQVDGQELNLAPPTPNPFPIETGGFLQWDYPDAALYDIGTIYNQVLPFWQLETRFLFSVISAAFAQFTPLEWGLSMLQGSIDPPPLSNPNQTGKQIWELYIRPSAASNNLSFIPIVVNGAGQRLTQLPGSPTVWQAYSNQGGWFLTPTGAAAGVPITVKVTRGPSGGVKFLIYKNDDPLQIIFQSTESPAPIVRTGNYHLEVAHAKEAPGSRFRFDYFNVSDVAGETPTGEVIYRRQYSRVTKVTGYTLNRILPTAGAKINVRIRSAEDVITLATLPFSDPMLPTSIIGNIETGAVTIAPGSFIDVKLEFIRASPSPTLTAFDFTTTPRVVFEDRPMILSVDELGPGLNSIWSSEEAGGVAETANTKKVADGDHTTQYTTINSTDGTSSTLQCNFLNATGGGEFRTIGAVIFRNTNVKRAIVRIGGTILFDGELTTDTEIVAFTPISTTLIHIDVISTKVANQTKKIGELYMGEILVTLPGFDEYVPARPIFEAGTFRTIGGKLISYRGKHKYKSNWAVSILDTTTKDSVEAIWATRPQVTFWPEPSARPLDLFDVGWMMAELPFPYTVKVKGTGFSINADVEEI